MLIDPDELFEALDADADGRLSRDDLLESALNLRWHWHQAPLFAVLDRFTVEESLSKDEFNYCIDLMAQDSNGPFGQILKRLPTPQVSEIHTNRKVNERHTAVGAALCGRPGSPNRDVVTFLEKSAGVEIAQQYDALLSNLGQSPVSLSTERTAVLIIDPQRSFTGGTWMQSIGTDGPRQVGPIEIAFEHCAELVGEIEQDANVMFTRCPFPPTSYQWHEALDGLLAPNQPYFIKPGNSVLWPPTNGFADWVRLFLKEGKETLVMGGCTLNSCVRVSAIETQHRFGKDGLQVIVDLSISGARLDNYVESPVFGGRSSVEAAATEMTANGVQVVPQISWENVR